MGESAAPHRTAVLVLPGVLPLEFGSATQIFGLDPHYDLTVCTGDPTRSVPGSGFSVQGTAGLEALGAADTVVISGYENPDLDVSGKVLDALRHAHDRGVRLASICTGAFALAAAGLLDGRPATTHWQHTDHLQRRYPAIDVMPNKLFVDDGDIVTSAGVTAGIDLCLHLIRRDIGAAAANRRARAIVAAPQRAGGQAQYIERLRPTSIGAQLADLREWMLQHLSQPQDIDMLAERASVSRRTLIRRFREETGSSPMAWLTSARLDHARDLLESTAEPIERVGRLAGLGSPANTRAAFHRHLAISPQGYRALFRGPNESRVDRAR